MFPETYIPSRHKLWKCLILSVKTFTQSLGKVDLLWKLKKQKFWGTMQACVVKNKSVQLMEIGNSTKHLHYTKVFPWTTYAHQNWTDRFLTRFLFFFTLLPSLQLLVHTSIVHTKTYLNYTFIQKKYSVTSINAKNKKRLNMFLLDFLQLTQSIKSCWMKHKNSQFYVTLVAARLTEWKQPIAYITPVRCKQIQWVRIELKSPIES